MTFQLNDCLLLYMPRTQWFALILKRSFFPISLSPIILNEMSNHAHTYYIYKLSATFLCLEIILYIDIMMLFWAVTNNSISPVGSHY